MKNVFLVRHAKSSWKDMSLRDIERPLNKRGKRDAPYMAKLLAGKVAKPDALISSPANRAFTTAAHFAKAWEIDRMDIIQKEEIYEAYQSDILEVIQALDEQWQSVFIFGHNPTFTMLANAFPGGGFISNVPTCGVVELHSQAEKWSLFSPKNTRLVHFYYPKQFFV